MNDRTRLALHLAAAGLALGVLGDLLLRVAPWGVNFLLWIAALAAAIALVVVKRRVQLKRGTAWLILLTVCAAAGVSWRDAEMLKALDLVAVATLLALAVWQAHGVRLALGGIVKQCLRVALVGMDTAAGYLPLLWSDVQWPKFRDEGTGRKVKSVLVGLVVALPLLLVFVALFMEADAVFDHLIRQVLDIDLGNAISHLTLTALWAWVAGGYLVALLFRQREDWSAALALPWRLNAIEANVTLGLLNALFLSFILVQIRYLFGGAHLVQVTPHLTYADYARRGFFELVAAAVLALAVLLALDWLLAPGAKRAFRWQAGAMVVMLFVVLASAFHRMRLYVSVFGWTELRFYVTAFMGWLAAVFAWFTVTVIRGRREPFAFGALVAGLVALATLHVWNPDAWIVRQNLAHYRAGHRFDANYAAHLSADAAPILVEALPKLDPGEQRVIATRLRAWMLRATPDWRIWSWSRAQAKRVLTPNRDLIEQYVSAQPAAALPPVAQQTAGVTP
jgi:hypothetical protein